MLSKLIHRPVAVLLSILAAVVLGVLAAWRLPVGLLPEVGIPKLSIQITYPNTSARSLENAVVGPLRQQLLQVNGLQDIYSRTRDENAVIYLDFPFGTDPDLAFIEVNEQLDRAMNNLPRELPRPRVLATDVADIPVVEMAITLKSTDEQPSLPAQLSGGEGWGGGIDATKQQLLALSEQARRVFRRRLEQLSTVAFADLSGQLERRIEIKPDLEQMRRLNISEGELANVLRAANLETGSLLLADGHFVYSVRLTNRLTEPEDIARLAILREGRLIYLEDIANIGYAAEPARGSFSLNGQPGIVFRVRKKSDSQLFLLREEINELRQDLADTYPQFEFTLLNDQSELLSASITNLRSGLLYGASFAILILFVFFREWKRPLLIALAVPVALLLALLGFYLVDLSINVISLAGLMLGLGLMIDNSIIVLENIQQLKSNGLPPVEAAWRGGQEVIGPLLSSALTTVAVFLPLVFLNGLSGALFRDQAIAVSLALAASLLVAYFLLPLLSRSSPSAGSQPSEESSDEKVSNDGTTNRSGHPPQVAGGPDENPSPDWQHSVGFRSKISSVLTSLFILLSVTLLGWLLVGILPLQGFPEISRTAFQLSIDWNEPISLRENESRCLAIAKAWRAEFGGNASAIVGEQRFLLAQENRATNEALLQFFMASEVAGEDLNPNLATSLVIKWQQKYPAASIQFSPVPNLFDRVFNGGSATELWLKIRSLVSQDLPAWRTILPLENLLREKGLVPISPARRAVLRLTINYEQLNYKRVDENALRSRLLSLFSENELTVLRSGDQQIPVVLANNDGSAELSIAKLQSAEISNRDGNLIPLSTLISIHRETDYKVITADRAGPFVQLIFPEELTASEQSLVQAQVTTSTGLTTQWGGSALAQREQLRALWGVLLTALLLLYLILAAQFESLVAPWVVLLTVPLSLVGTLFALWLAAESLNLVSMIGMVVTGGIVVNDAIIKLDMINKGRRELDLSIPEALRYANRRRIRAIIMTSLTTILALGPVLFTSGLGAELQRPLAIAVIGGLVVGTLASLYVLPVFYRALVR